MEVMVVLLRMSVACFLVASLLAMGLITIRTDDGFPRRGFWFVEFLMETGVWGSFLVGFSCGLVSMILWGRA